MCTVEYLGHSPWRGRWQLPAGSLFACWASHVKASTSVVRRRALRVAWNQSEKATTEVTPRTVPWHNVTFWFY